jgi:hypothetical protein
VVSLRCAHVAWNLLLSLFSSSLFFFPLFFLGSEICFIFLLDVQLFLRWSHAVVPGCQFDFDFIFMDRFVVCQIGYTFAMCKVAYNFLPGTFVPTFSTLKEGPTARMSLRVSIELPSRCSVA